MAAVVEKFGRPLLLLILSAVAFGYFLFQAPLWCGAEIRHDPEGTGCRDNASGLLLGCYRRQHKWQRLKALFRLKQLGHFLMSTPAQKLATASGLISLGVMLYSAALYVWR
jgi:hypothetical protein